MTLRNFYQTFRGGFSNIFGNTPKSNAPKEDSNLDYKHPELYIEEHNYHFCLKDFIGPNKDKFVVVIDTNDGLLGKIGELSDVYNHYATFTTDDGYTTRISVFRGIPLKLYRSLEPNCKFSVNNTYGNECISYYVTRKFA